MKPDTLIVLVWAAGMLIYIVNNTIQLHRDWQIQQLMNEINQGDEHV